MTGDQTEPSAAPDPNELLAQSAGNVARSHGVTGGAFAAKGSVDGGQYHFFVMVAPCDPSDAGQLYDELPKVLAATGLEGTTTDVSAARERPLRDVLLYSVQESKIVAIRDALDNDLAYVLLAYASEDENRVQDVRTQCERVMKLG